MRRILELFIRTTIIPSVIIAMANIANAMQSQNTELETLAATQQKAFLITAAWTVFAAIVAAILGVWAYVANERLGAAIQRDANSKLANVADTAKAADDRAKDLQDKLRPRSLSAEQITALSEFLKSKPKAKILVRTVANNGEAIEYANEFKKTLGDCGWTVRGDVSLSGPTPKGLILAAKDSDSNATRNLAEAFDSAHLEYERLEAPWAKDDEIVLFVGGKP